MIVDKFAISNFRNLRDVEVSFGKGLNVFYGENGAGKTSVLEALHFLSRGRSFKTRNPRHLIQYNKKSFLLIGDIVSGDLRRKVGLEKSTDSVRISINGQRTNGFSSIAELVPTISLHPDTFSLLTGDPIEKRAFLDWGCFYEDPLFSTYWKNYQVALKQRNAALRAQSKKSLIECWDSILSENGERISESRIRYIKCLLNRIPELSSGFGQSLEISIRYQRGWASEVALAEQLKASIEGDIKSGFTRCGPQRASFRTLFNGHDAAHGASRGQLKLITLILKLAQASEFVDQKRSDCLLLLDDLDAELDANNFYRFIKQIDSFGFQVLLTTLNHERITGHSDRVSGLFHVEHGEIKQML